MGSLLGKFISQERLRQGVANKLTHALARMADQQQPLARTTALVLEAHPAVEHAALHVHRHERGRDEEQHEAPVDHRDLDDAEVQDHQHPR